MQQAGGRGMLLAGRVCSPVGEGGWGWVGAWGVVWARAACCDEGLSIGRARAAPSVRTRKRPQTDVLASSLHLAVRVDAGRGPVSTRTLALTAEATHPLAPLGLCPLTPPTRVGLGLPFLQLVNDHVDLPVQTSSVFLSPAPTAPANLRPAAGGAGVPVP